MYGIGEVLFKTIEAMPVRKLYKEKTILWNWPQIIGADIAQQSEAVSIEFGVLYLAVKNSVWCHHLSMMKAEVIAKVNAFVKEPLIRDVKFRNTIARKKQLLLEEEEAVEDSLFRQLRTIALDRQEVAAAGTACDGIRDEKLRLRLRRLYEKHLKVQKIKKMAGWGRCEACGALCQKDARYCSCCLRQQRQQRCSQIRKMLREVPWSTYAEINRYIPCTAEEYIDAKISLLHRISEQIGPDEETGMHAKVLTMLFTGVKYDALNEQMIQKTIDKFRRKRYVSAPGR